MKEQKVRVRGKWERRLHWSVVKCEKLQLKLQYKMPSSTR